MTNGNGSGAEGQVHDASAEEAKTAGLPAKDRGDEGDDDGNATSGDEGGSWGIGREVALRAAAVGVVVPLTVAAKAEAARLLAMREAVRAAVPPAAAPGVLEAAYSAEGAVAAQ